jgi:HPt (histidine-containing phosphotransfer) domain-containing protein
VQARDAIATAAAAHALKGESANAAAHRLNALALELETAAKRLAEEIRASYGRVEADAKSLGP